MHKVARRHFRHAVYTRIHVYASSHEKVSTGNLLSPPQRLPLGIPIKISIIEKIESALSFSFSPASPQHKEACAEERDTKPLVWKRYPFINDMFSLWDTDKEEINMYNFIEHANNYHPTIKFTADISDKEIFLDTCIYKGARFEKEYILDMHTYFKPTETFQYTHPVIHTRSKKAS